MRTIALFTTMPVNMMMPIIATTLMVVEVRNIAHTTPIRPSGIVNRMTKGWTSDSNCEAITRYTSSTASASVKVRDRRLSCISSLCPDR